MKLNICLSQRVSSSGYRTADHECATLAGVTLNEPLSPTRIWTSPILNPLSTLTYVAPGKMIIDNHLLIAESKGEEKFSSDSTKRVMLEICDGLAQCFGSGRAYQTRLDSRPAPHAATIRHCEQKRTEE